MTLRPVEPELYRCFYVTESDSGSFDPRRLVAWERILENDRGRWEDPHDSYRVLYTATAEVTALIEVLCALRPSRRTIDAIAAIEDPDEPQPLEEALAQARAWALAAAHDRLAPRYMACLLTQNAPYVFDVLSGASRTELETAFGLPERSLKTGDFATRNLAFTRNVSRYVFERTGAVGIYATFAEDGDGYTTTFFEADARNGELRVGHALTVEGTQRALTCESLPRALAYLDLVPATDSRDAPSAAAAETAT